MAELIKIIPEKVLEKAYEDAGTAPAKELGAISANLMKSLHLFLAPFQLAAAWQDRFARYLDVIRNKVPAERQTESPPEIAGPVFDALRFVEETSPIKELYLNLLARSIDVERQNEAHPAFVSIINQLSRDEAIILNECGRRPGLPAHTRKQATSRDIEQFGGPEKKFTVIAEHLDFLADADSLLAFPKRASLYCMHLQQMLLVDIKHCRSEIDRSSGGATCVHNYCVQLTDFGNLFFRCCIT